MCAAQAGCEGEKLGPIETLVLYLFLAGVGSQSVPFFPAVLRWASRTGTGTGTGTGVADAAVRAGLIEMTDYQSVKVGRSVSQSAGQSVNIDGYRTAATAT